ncbi:hypothetical protein ScPMuIL_017559 [Solemya velum]
MSNTYTSRPVVSNRARKSDRNPTDTGPMENHGDGRHLRSTHQTGAGRGQARTSGPTRLNGGPRQFNPGVGVLGRPTGVRPVRPVGPVVRPSRSQAPGMDASRMYQNRGGTMALDQSHEDSLETSAAEAKPRQLSYQGGYSVLPPDEKKRQAIQNQARKETENFEAYKQQSRPGHVSYVGTVGGGFVDEAAARKKIVQDNSKYARIQRQQQYKDATRKTENEDITRKKIDARKKAEMNEQRNIREQKRTEQMWADDHKRKNEEFLRRLESQSSNQAQSFKKGRPASSDVPSTLYDTKPVRMDRNSTDEEDALNTGGSDPRLRGLIAMFPNYDAAYLSELLSQMNSVDDVIDILSA